MLRFHNTLTGQKDEFRPLEDGVVRMYTCGPTVYNYAHIGNFRTFVFQDLLRRYLKLRGFNLIHVMNITDVEDKIIRDAKAQGITIGELTAKYTEAFLEDARALRIEVPEILPRATEHIPEMVALVKRLEGRGLTYSRDGSVYFSIGRFPGYGKLSRKDFSGIQGGISVDTDEYEKDDARDFVLWKARKEGEDYWETELGPGRPGWHIECSAMSMKYLGETFDLHCGGVDLVFPHHENEIAQSEGATGKPFARYWLHSEFLLIEGEKMAKSKGNQFTLLDLLAKGYSAESIRYLLLSVHYRRQLNLTFDGLHQAQASISRLEDFVRQMKDKASATDMSPDFSAEVESAWNGFLQAMDDDLNTSAALAVVFDFVRSVYQRQGRGELTGGDARAALGIVEDADRVLAVLRPEEELLDSEILRQIDARNAARKRRDFAESDRIRQWLLSKGIQLEDSREGTRWKRLRQGPGTGG
jgi:cysteinyl-tRNA synthetase